MTTNWCCREVDNCNLRETPGSLPLRPTIPTVTLPIKRVSLPIGILKAPAGAFAAELFALFFPGIPGQKSVLLQNRAQTFIGFNQGACNPETDGTGLPGLPAAVNIRSNAELIGQLGNTERIITHDSK